MKLRLTLLSALFLLILSAVFSSTPLDNLECSWMTYPTASCNGNDDILAASGQYWDETQSISSGQILSSPVRLINANSNYNRCLRCELGEHIEDADPPLQFTYENVSQSCLSGYQPILYFTDDTNARVAVDYNDSHHEYVSCVRLPSQFSRMQVVVSDDPRFENNLNYQCLYRFNQEQSGLIGSCDSQYGSGQKYSHAVLARVWEDLGSLDCNSDCTSKLDNRVYSDCAALVNACVGVEPVCDGAIYGSWVLLNQFQEVQCSSPWTNTRFRAFTNEPVRISTQDNQCQNLLSNSYTVFVDNQPVTMRVYTCID